MPNFFDKEKHVFHYENLQRLLSCLQNKGELKLSFSIYVFCGEN